MDGYASVKENLGSSVEEQIKYNVEAEGSVMTLAMRDQVRRVTRLWHKVAHKVDKWSDERWIRDLNQVVENRTARQEPRTLRTGQLVFELKALPTTGKNEDVCWQVLQFFQCRDWKRPENIEDPFTEPKIDNMVTQLVHYMRAQDKRNRQLVQLVSELHAHQFPAGTEPPELPQLRNGSPQSLKGQADVTPIRPSDPLAVASAEGDAPIP